MNYIDFNCVLSSATPRTIYCFFFFHVKQLNMFANGISLGTWDLLIWFTHWKVKIEFYVQILNDTRKCRLNDVNGWIWFNVDIEISDFCHPIHIDIAFSVRLRASNLQRQNTVLIISFLSIKSCRVESHHVWCVCNWISKTSRIPNLTKEPNVELFSLLWWTKNIMEFQSEKNCVR